MQTINTGGPPGPPPGFRGMGGGRRNRGGFWSRLMDQPFGFKIQVFGSFLGILAILCYLVWRFIPISAAKEPEPTPVPPEPAIVRTVPPLESPADLPPAELVTAPGTVTETMPTIPPPPTLAAPLTAEQAAATATFQAAINKPAYQNAPGAAPYFVGVITYESGCPASNLGFTTSGYNGQPYYLYLRQPLDRSPLMQLVQLTGVIQVLPECDHPLIFVDQLFWMDMQGTPSPLASPTPAHTATITITVTAPWGVVAAGPPAATKIYNTIASAPTPTATYYMPAPFDIPNPSTPLPTYTPYPTYTPIPKDIIVHTVIPLIPTQTPQPTYTPFPTPTANPQANISGAVINVVGCASSNLAIQTGPGEYYYLIFAGAALPPTGQPTDYHALAVGVLDVACNGKAIKANSITWYSVTPTPTPSPTMTATPTLTPTVTPTFTPTITPTETITP